MAFVNDEDGINIGMTVFDSGVNLLFLCDIIVQFFTAFYDSDYNIVDQRKVSFSCLQIISDDCVQLFDWLANY